MTLTYALVTLLAASYVSYVCFYIVYRMSKRTPWSLALTVIGLAGLAGSSFVDSVICIASFVAGFYPNIKPFMFALTIGAAVVLLVCPRIQTEPRHDHHKA
jgi:uncharacterized membrane protein HdeD (DUF308 family)